MVLPRIFRGNEDVYDFVKRCVAKKPNNYITELFLGWKEKKLSIWIKCNFNKIEMFKSYFGIVVVGSFLWKKVIKVVKIPKRKDCQMSYTWEHFYCISNRYSNIWSQSSTYYNTSPRSCPCLVWSSTVHCPCDSNLNQIWFFSGGKLTL